MEEVTPPMLQLLPDVSPSRGISLLDVTKNTLQELGFETKDESLIQFLSQRMFDHGLLHPPEKVDLPEALSAYSTHYQTERKPLIVLSSTMMPLLKRKGYRVVTQFDVGNVLGANSVPINKKNIFGDYLLHDICQAAVKAFEGTPLCLIRLKGDEFALVHKPLADIDSSVIDKARDNAETQINQAIKDLKGLFQVKDEKTATVSTQFLPVTVTLSAEKPATIRVDSERRINTTLHQRVEWLQEQHKELNTILESLSANDQKTSEFVSLLEDILYDPLTHPLEEKIRELSTPQLSFHVYKDRTDFIAHLQERGGEQQLFRIGVPGVLKMVNKYARDSYREGDRFIQQEFEDIARVITSVVVAENLADIRILRSGSDFYVAVYPPVQSAEKLQHKFEASFTNYAEQRHFSFEPNDGLSSLPILRTAAVAPVNMIAAEPNNYQVLAQNEQTYFQALESLETATWDRTRYMFKNYFKNGVPASDWLYLAQYYNPYDKRGILRLNRIPEISGTDTIDKLSTFYTQSSDKEWQFDMAKLEEFKALSKYIL